MSTKKHNKSAQTPALKSFADHLGELRGRLAWVAMVFIVASAVAYNFREPLVSFVLAPIGDQKLVYLTPAGGFAFIFQVTMYAGILATAPIAIYHLYRFVAPALPKHTQRVGMKLVGISTLLMLAGVSFGYFVAIPAALQFLTTFAGDFVTPNLTADSYLNFVTAYLLGLGLLFQLPLLLVIWNWMQPFKPGGLLGTQQYVLVGSFIAAALITPTPDALNQMMIAVPIIGVYQLGVVAVYFMNKKRRRKEAQAPVGTKVSTVSKQASAGTAQTPNLPPRKPVTPQVSIAPVLAQSVRHRVKTRHYSVDGFNRVSPVRRELRPLRPIARPAVRSTPVYATVSRRNVPRPARDTSIDGIFA